MSHRLINELTYTRYITHLKAYLTLGCLCTLTSIQHMFPPGSGKLGPLGPPVLDKHIYVGQNEI